MNIENKNQHMKFLTKVALGVEYLETTIEFQTHLRSSPPPSFMKQATPKKNAHISVAISRILPSVRTQIAQEIMQIKEQNVDITKAVLGICTTMVSSIHAHRDRSGNLHVNTLCFYPNKDFLMHLNMFRVV